MAELKGKQLMVATIVSLLIIGALGYEALPEAYCPLEDKTVKYVHMSESQKTVTKVLPSDGGEGYVVLGDRCQKGREIGEWIPVNSDAIKTEECKCRPLVLAYTDNGKWFCDDVGMDANCIKDSDVELPVW